MTTRAMAAFSVALNLLVLSLMFMPSIWGHANSPLRFASFPTGAAHGRLSSEVAAGESATSDLESSVDSNSGELEDHAARLDALASTAKLMREQIEDEIQRLGSRAGMIELQTENLTRRQEDDEKMRGFQSCVAGLPTQQQFCYDVWF